VRVRISSLITVVTFGSVAISEAISISWFFTVSGGSRFEPAIQMLGLLGGLAGVLGERRAAARERRHLTLVALVDELRMDSSILGAPYFSINDETPRPRVYPRLPISATDAALTSGALTNRGDEDLLRRLHNWRDVVNGFNRRLELTEIRIFTSDRPGEITEFERALHGSDSYLNAVRDHLFELLDFFPFHYSPDLKQLYKPDEDADPRECGEVWYDKNDNPSSSSADVAF
jgi:hypothetical protein